MNEYEFRLADVRLTLRDTQYHQPLDRLYAFLSLLSVEDQKLEINPDYSRSVEDVYTDVACFSLVKQHHLDLLEACELSTQDLNIPTWVPDWSSCLKIGTIPVSNWSACGWISAEAEIIDNRTMRVAGVKAAYIKQVIEEELHEHPDFDDIVWVLRRWKPSEEYKRHQGRANPHQLEQHCRCMNSDIFRHDFLPPRDDRPDLTESMKDPQFIWSSEASWQELFFQENSNMSTFLAECVSHREGRSFVRATNGLFGHAPVGTQPSDLVSILFGCRFPVILRPLHSTWQVVGVCNILGLMHGEAIYRNKLPNHYRPFHAQDEETPINGWRYALYDPKTSTRKTDPAQILQEAAIEVESYQREPHRLEVLLQTLKKAGVAVEYFNLV
jgi:hypothetical protein